jgi:hypothetical protein
MAVNAKPNYGADGCAWCTRAHGMGGSMWQRHESQWEVWSESSSRELTGTPAPKRRDRLNDRSLVRAESARKPRRRE